MSWSRLIVSDNYRRTETGYRKKFGREIDRHPHAACGRRITGQMPGVHRDTSPSQPLHMWHLSALINAGGVTNLFLQDGKYSGRCTLARLARAHRRSSYANAVSIDVYELIWQAHKDHNRPAW